MHLVFLTPSPDPAGGGARFNAGLIPALRALGHQVDVQHDASTLPEAALPIIDGLLLPDLEPDLQTLLARDAVIVIHHVSARAGPSCAIQNLETRETVHAIERRMLPAFRRIVATSAPVAQRLSAIYGLPTPLILIPGLPSLPRSLPDDRTCRIISPGVLTLRKGHDRLLRALARLQDLDWTLTIAGDAQRDPAQAAAIAALIPELGLSSRVTLLPDPAESALDAAWAGATLFALASSWEGYPSGVAEALRRGIPVVATAIGEIGSMVPLPAGILAPPDDPATLSKCLRRAIFDHTLRGTLAEGAWQAGQALPGWPQQANAFLDLIRS